MENTVNKQEAIDSFKNAKVVYLVTSNEDGIKHSRPMTNFNDNPYETIWFPSYNNTKKIEDITENSAVKIIYPSLVKDKFYEIEGKAQLADRHEVEEKWVWWYLYWHPEMNDYFWFDQTSEHPERVIVNIHPRTIKGLDKNEVKLVRETYSSLLPVD